MNGDAVDTGQYGAARFTPNSPQDQEKVFANFKERMRKLLKEEVTDTAKATGSST